MGTIHHHAIVVTGYDDHIDRAHRAAKDIFPFVSEVSAPATNCYQSFFIPPDGSKEGWGESEEGDIRRSQFITKLREMHDCYVDYIEVEYGELGNGVCRTNCD